MEAWEVTHSRNLNSSKASTLKRNRTRQFSDVVFFLTMGGLSACFILLIVLLLVADLMFTSPQEFANALRKPEIQAAFRLTDRKSVV